MTTTETTVQDVTYHLKPPVKPLTKFIVYLLSQKLTNAMFYIPHKVWSTISLQLTFQMRWITSTSLYSSSVSHACVIYASDHVFTLVEGDIPCKPNKLTWRDSWPIMTCILLADM